MPVIVFNSGLEFAAEIGLNRVLQNDTEAGMILGQELRLRNYSNPLAVQLTSSIDNVVYNLRMNGISDALGVEGIQRLALWNYNNTNQAIEQVESALLEGNYDSVISLGGTVCAFVFSYQI